jgi:ferredoxin-NADP reductase
MTSATAERPRTGTTELAMAVRQLRWEADGVMSVELSALDGSVLPPWTPGAHIDLHLPTGITRQYSLCGSPQDRHHYRIGVLREAASRGGSEYVHTYLRPSQPVRVRGPRDNFGFRRADSYLFIAGGIGITPILPMIHQAAAWGASWQLVYGGRKAASMAFLDELRPYHGRVRLYPQEEAGLIPLSEWLDRPQETTDIYACGPEPLLTAVERGSAHWRPGALHVERFTPRTRSQPVQNTAVEVVCARSNKTVTVPPERSILAALEDEGIPVASSCHEGVCGTCETKVLEGEPDHRDEILSEADRAAGDRMFVCVSRARSGRLVLDV